MSAYSHTRETDKYGGKFLTQTYHIEKAINFVVDSKNHRFIVQNDDDTKAPFSMYSYE